MQRTIPTRLTSAGSPFRTLDTATWRAIDRDMLSPVGERVPAGTLVKIFQSRNFGWVLIHPTCTAVKRRLFKE